ncbi:glucose-6-phosphate dehydrogenase [Catenuloplanes sp. NPDC051500]|uniref:glucose-6-phosphate dehydrogenase n=1 Tax=Catenuloplanes sp. NPDC051500 TaxID=3363959 RepID=UPI0037AE3EE4
MNERADAVVLFGVTGDLAAKKLIPALYELTRRGRLDLPVIGVARSAWDHEQLVKTVRKAVVEAVDVVDEAAFDALTARMTMISGGYDDARTYARLAAELADAKNPLFYLAIPPTVFTDVVNGLRELADRGRVVVEKPFGYDLASAQALAVTLRSAFAPERIFRIDHYLGKEAVEGITAVRFGNRLLEPIWSREHIDNVQITLAEQFGTQGRAGFYDRSGAVRDVLQNHVLQVAALLAMEPGGSKSDELHALRRMRPLTPASTVFGQYVGYRDEPGVGEGSTTETFVAATLRIDTRRWAGVPFHLRAGKHLGETATEVVVTLRPSSTAPSTPNLLRLRLGKKDGLGFTLNVKAPGRDAAATRAVPLDVDFGTVLGERQEAYERLIDDALDGRQDRFASEETIREEWRIVAPVLDAPMPILPYERGSWGPETPGTLPTGGWHAVGGAGR